jgi:hypothetical protein
VRAELLEQTYDEPARSIGTGTYGSGEPQPRVGASRVSGYLFGARAETGGEPAGGTAVRDREG